MYTKHNILINYQVTGLIGTNTSIENLQELAAKCALCEKLLGTLAKRNLQNGIR